MLSTDWLFATLQSVVATAMTIPLAYGIPLISMVRPNNTMPITITRNWPTPLCDVYQPALDVDIRAPNVLLVFIHGGGWHSGAKDATWWVGHAFVGESMASRGIATAVLTYPLSRIPWTMRLAFFGALAVFALALAWLLSRCGVFSFRTWLEIAVVCYVFVAVQVYYREFHTTGNADCTIHQQRESIHDSMSKLQVAFPGRRIVLAGHSAGGHLAMLYATASRYTREKELAAAAANARLVRAPGAVMSPATINSVIGISGVYDVAHLLDVGVPLIWFVRHYCLAPTFPNATAEMLESFSPVNWLAELSVPRVLLVTAARDHASLVHQADKMYAHLHAHAENDGGNSTHQYKRRVRDIGLGHGFGLLWSSELWRLVEQECIDVAAKK